MKATHHRPSKGNVCFMAIKQQVDVGMIEYAIKLLIQSEKKPTRRSVIAEIKDGLKQYGSEGFYNRLDLSNGDETTMFDYPAKVRAKELFPDFYKNHFNISDKK